MPLNFTIFNKLCNCTIFSGSFLNLILLISFLHFPSFKYTTITDCILKRWMCDLMEHRLSKRSKWYFFPNASIFYTSVVSCYIICTFKRKQVKSYLAKALKWSLFQVFLILIDLLYVLHFDSSILSNIFMCNFLVWLGKLVFMLVLGLIRFRIFKSTVLNF